MATQNCKWESVRRVKIQKADMNNPSLLVCTILLSILATQEYTSTTKTLGGGEGGDKITLDSLNYHFFYLTVKCRIPVFKPNFRPLQAGPAPQMIGKHDDLHHC